MKAIAHLLGALAVLSTAASCAQDGAQSSQPITWGILTRNSGCVIFAEGHKTTGKFYGIAATTKTVGKLTVIEAQNYTFPQKEVVETQESMNDLMQIAQKDRLKFVKIPEKYSPELLEKARASCNSDSR